MRTALNPPSSCALTFDRPKTFWQLCAWTGNSVMTAGTPLPSELSVTSTVSGALWRPARSLRHPRQDLPDELDALLLLLASRLVRLSPITLAPVLIIASARPQRLHSCSSPLALCVCLLSPWLLFSSSPQQGLSDFTRRGPLRTWFSPGAMPDASCDDQAWHPSPPLVCSEQEVGSPDLATG